MSVIEYEIMYPSDPHFVFHDSRGIEAGAETDGASELRIEHSRSASEINCTQSGMYGHNMNIPIVKGLIYKWILYAYGQCKGTQ